MKQVPTFGSAAVACLCLMLAGCPTGTSTKQSLLQKAAIASQQAMIVVQGFQQGEILTYNQGKSCVAAATDAPSKAQCVVISDEDHLFIQQSLESIFKLDKTTNTCIGSATTPTAAAACANSAVTTIEQLQTDGALHIKSVSARQDFALAMMGAKTTLSVVATILGGK